MTPKFAGSVAYHLMDAPSGLPLVLIHGFCEDSSVWNTLLPLINVRPLIWMDLPGFGHSAVPAEGSVRAYAEAVSQVLLQEGYPQAVILGHSLGGYAALEFARLFPQNTAGLSLFHSHPYADNAERKTARQRGIETIQSGKKDLYVAQLFPGLFAPAFAAEHPEIVQKMIEQGKKQSAEGIVCALESMRDREDRHDVLREIQCPVQFILGTEDALIPTDMALKSAVLPATCDLQLIPGAGHMAMLEAPAPAAEAINQFVSFCSIFLNP